MSFNKDTTFYWVTPLVHFLNISLPHILCQLPFGLRFTISKCERNCFHTAPCLPFLVLFFSSFLFRLFLFPFLSFAFWFVHLWWHFTFFLIDESTQGKHTCHKKHHKEQNQVHGRVVSGFNGHGICIGTGQGNARPWISFSQRRLNLFFAIHC